MKKVIIILVIVAIIIIANVLIFNLSNNNEQVGSTNTHVNTNINRINNENETDTTSGENEVNQVEQATNNNTDYSTVYFTSNISSDGLMNIYQALGFEPQGNVAIKLSTGEAGGNYYLSPDLIRELVQSVDGTIVECNTAYGGSRSNTAMHRQVAEDHGFTRIANVDILDENGSMNLTVPNGTHLEYDMVGANYANYDSVIVLSHFKGHSMAGFGGAVKNISIGFASSSGKSLIHSAGTRTSGFGGASQDDFLESMAEAASAVATDKGDDIVYISVMNNLSVDCDCDSNPAEPDMHDIGILASTDPVALDKACVDLVYEAPDGASLIQRMESRNGIHTLEYGAEIGLGNLNYEIVNIDARQ